MRAGRHVSGRRGRSGQCLDPIPVLSAEAKTLAYVGLLCAKQNDKERSYWSEGGCGDIDSLV